jgi:hypothetical protein
MRTGQRAMEKLWIKEHGFERFRDPPEEDPDKLEHGRENVLDVDAKATLPR